MIKLGIEGLLGNPSIVKGMRAGLIANAASVDGELRSSVDLLHGCADIDLACVFGAQQGFWGETQDNMIEWEGGRYPRYDLPLYSLYGKDRKPTAGMLKDIDALIFDCQDIGTRVYTFIWTMALAMQASAEHGKRFIVCDRPNPIGGLQTEGNVSTKEFASFVALYPLPMRHGMTAGEIANYINAEFGIGCNLNIIGLKGWKRKLWHDETGLPWVMPSANMPGLDTATVYPGTVMFEGTNVSEGRGTTRPFEFVGAPFADGFDLADALAEFKLPGIKFRPCVFMPAFNKHQGQNCGGVQLHITDRNEFKPARTGLAILKTIHDMYPNKFEWKEPPYEYVFDRPPIDVILGCDWISASIERGDSLASIIERMDSESRLFEKTRRKYLLY